MRANSMRLAPVEQPHESGNWSRSRDRLRSRWSPRSHRMDTAASFRPASQVISSVGWNDIVKLPPWRDCSICRHCEQVADHTWRGPASFNAPTTFYPDKTRAASPATFRPPLKRGPLLPHSATSPGNAAACLGENTGGFTHPERADTHTPQPSDAFNKVNINSQYTELVADPTIPVRS